MADASSASRVGDEPDLRVPVTIMTGFLGAGKTTLVNNVLGSAEGKKFAVIENEFGEIGIDDELVKQKFATEEEIFEMNNGCLCCTVRGDLIRILHKIMEKQAASGRRLDGILVETTGLADPAPVAQTFFVDPLIAKFARLDSILTVVDAKHVVEHLDEVKPEGVENEAVEQLAFADRILLNKVDLVDEETLRAVERRIRGINAFAPILRTTNCSVPLDAVLNVHGFSLARVLEMEPAFDTVADDDHKHDDRVGSLSLRLDRALHAEGIQTWIRALAIEHGKSIFRMKGVLAVGPGERRIVVQGVHMLVSVEEATSSPDRSSKMVFIGRDLESDAIRAGFLACAVPA